MLVIWDLGKVLVDVFEVQRMTALLRRAGASMDWEQFRAESRMQNFELGRITCGQFLDNVYRLLRGRIRMGEIRSAWFGFAPISTMFKAARKIKRHAKTVILSNTNELHWNYIDRAFGASRLVHNVYLSCRLGLRKPGAEIFEHVLRREGIPPQQTIFVDDRPENIAAARSLGIHGILHNRNRPTLKYFARNGLLA